VNAAGDKALSRQIYYQIERNLGGSVPQAPAEGN